MTNRRLLSTVMAVLMIAYCSMGIGDCKNPSSPGPPANPGSVTSQSIAWRRVKAPVYPQNVNFTPQIMIRVDFANVGTPRYVGQYFPVEDCKLSSWDPATGIAVCPGLAMPPAPFKSCVYAMDPANPTPTGQEITIGGSVLAAQSCAGIPGDAVILSPPATSSGPVALAALLFRRNDFSP
jgi:hypothetical protein